MAAVNAIMCEVCNIPLDNEKNLASHLKGKKHKLALHNAYVSKVKESCGVFITGFPHGIAKDEIIDFISAQGRLIECHIGEDNKYAIVQFKYAEVAKEILKKPIFFMGKRLLIKPRKLRENKPHQDIGTGLNLDTLIAPLQSIPRFEEQVAALMEILQPQSTEMYGKYHRLCLDLEKILRYTFDGCKVHPFGSTVTGLDFAGSDVDAYVFVPVQSKEPDPQLRAAALVRKANNALYKGGMFVNIVPIPRAKTPIVKCVHKLFNISCDINFKNRLGVCNSHLIRFYLSLSPRLRTTMLILKCWAKMHDLIGTNGKFSSYSFSMLFIFYLQQPPYKIPPTRDLQQNPYLNDLQEGWNAGFDHNYRFRSPCLDSASIVELLYGFFSFYNKFEYSVNLICPYLGQALVKTEFMNADNLPCGFDRYRDCLNAELEPILVETPLCIQDPFEQNHNISRAVAMRNLDDFCTLCKQAMEITKAGSQKLSLYSLLMEEAEEVMQGRGTDKLCGFKISMGVSLSYLEKELPAGCKDKVQSLQAQWFIVVNNFIISVLIRILKLEVALVKDEAPSNNKSMKLDGQTDVYDKISVDTVNFKCEGMQNLWEARRSLSKGLVYPDDVVTTFDREVHLSNYICSVLLKDVAVSQPVIDFRITLEACTNPTRVEVLVRNGHANKKLFKAFCSFFMSKVPFWFDQHEKERNMEAKEGDDATHKA